MNGVFAVNDIEFEISRNGRNVGGASFVTVSGMESFAISFDNGVEQWNPIDARGWARRLVTAKSMTVSLSGKRVFGCAGNDFVAEAAYRSGGSLLTTLAVIFPNGDELRMDCVLNVTASGGGGASDIAVLEFDCLSDGRPVYTRANGQVVGFSAAAPMADETVEVGGVVDVSN